MVKINKNMAVEKKRPTQFNLKDMTLFTILKTNLEEFKKNYHFFKKVGLKKRFFVITTILNFISASFGGIGFALLIPLAQGIISKDFSFLTDHTIFSKVITVFPLLNNVSDLTIFIILATLIFISSSIKILFGFLTKIYQAKEYMKIGTNTNKFLFKKYLELGKPYFDKSNIAEESMIIARMQESIVSGLKELDSLIFNIMNIFIYTIIMITISYKLFFISIFFVPIIFLITNTLFKKIRKSAQDEFEAEFNIPKVFYNCIAKLPITLVSNKEEQEIAEFGKASTMFGEKRYIMQKAMSSFQPINETLLFLSLLIFVSILGYLSYNFENANVGVYLVFFYIFKNFLTKSLDLLADRVRLTIRLIGLNTKIEKIENNTEAIVVGGSESINEIKQEIECKKLDFAYEKNKNVLKEISFKIPANEVTAIIGKTGSGKSTLINLLLRFYDCKKNQLLFDGKDVKDLKIREVRKLFSYSGQDTIIFNDTLYNNITFGAPKNVSKGKVNEVIKKAQLEEFVNKLDKGLNSIVGDRGVNISGGEKQRIGIARTLLRDAPIVIFDEATSALDSETEEKINLEMRNYLKGKTVIIIAHRLSTIKYAENIIALEDGKVIEQGKSKDLFAKKGYFYKIWKAQMTRSELDILDPISELEILESIKKAMVNNSVLVISTKGANPANVKNIKLEKGKIIDET